MFTCALTRCLLLSDAESLRRSSKLSGAAVWRN